MVGRIRAKVNQPTGATLASADGRAGTESQKAVTVPAAIPSASRSPVGEAAGSVNVSGWRQLPEHYAPLSRPVARHQGFASLPAVLMLGTGRFRSREVD
jgi:hypothetical protein